jgi:DNA-binding NtrC family response regulator
VDDETIIADTLAHILRLSGFDVSVAHSGEAAIEHARNRPVDVLVSDVVMAGVNGVEAALRIREICPRCRIILISGALGDTLCSEVEKHDFDYLPKPFHPTVLLSRVEAAALLPAEPNAA